MLRLLGYELKKIVRRPFTLVVCLGCLAVLAFVLFYAASQVTAYAWGPELFGSLEAVPQKEREQAARYYSADGTFDGTVVYTGRKAIQLERERARRFAGLWDDAALEKMAAEYGAFIKNPDIYREKTLDEWAMQLRAWSLADGGLTAEEIEDYNAKNPIYLLKPEVQAGEMQQWYLMDRLLDGVILRADGSAKPFAEAFPLVDGPARFEYNDGAYRTTMLQGSLVGVLILLLVLVGAAPIFSEEVSSGTEPMLLAAKYGRDKLIAAKLLAGFGFTAACTLALTLLNALFTGICFGFGGFGMPVHFNIDTYGLPFGLTFFQYLLAIAGCQLLGALAMAALLMLLSSAMRSAFPVLFCGGVFSVLGILLANQAGAPLRHIMQALPPGAMTPTAMLYNGADPGLGFLPLPQWAMPLIVCGLIAAACAVVTYRRCQRVSQNGR